MVREDSSLRSDSRDPMRNPSSNFNVSRVAAGARPVFPFIVANPITEPAADKHKNAECVHRKRLRWLLCEHWLRAHRASIEIEGRGANGIGAKGPDVRALEPVKDLHFGMAIGIVVTDRDDRIPGLYRGQKSGSRRRLAAVVANFKPVSYTHLDVYKRQACTW